MALFTDGPAADLEDLTAQDTQLPNVASVEGIDVTQKLALAQGELAIEITTLLSGLGGVTPPTIDNLVVTPALKLWHTFRALELVYGDAYTSQLNPRYQSNRDQFHERARWAYERFLLTGAGIAWSPVPQAAQPQLVSTQGNLGNGTYYVAMTWVNSRGEEGAPSLVMEIAITASSFSAQPAAAPACAEGWNVYVGTDPQTLSRQNGSLIAVSQAWVQANAVVTGGIGPSGGQAPNYLLPLPRMILRG